MSAYYVIVQDPIYGFDLDGRRYTILEYGTHPDGTRKVEISTDSVVTNESDPSATFQYQIVENNWKWRVEEWRATGWDQFHDPFSILNSLVKFLNNNHPPVMTIYRD
jgi:hypothetical protein